MFEELEKLQAEEGVFYKQDTCGVVESVTPDKIAEKILQIFSEGLTKKENNTKSCIASLLQDVFSGMSITGLEAASLYRRGGLHL